MGTINALGVSKAALMRLCREQGTILSFFEKMRSEFTDEDERCMSVVAFWKALGVLYRLYRRYIISLIGSPLTGFR
eukprot:scaffold8356_cov106-Skeletonema_dohrnii-CCMP3373.AAC.3